LLRYIYVICDDAYYCHTKALHSRNKVPLIRNSLYKLADEQVEYPFAVGLRSRASFGLGIEECEVPQCKGGQAQAKRRPDARDVIEASFFGFRYNTIGGKFIRAFGLAIADVKIGFMSTTYNLMRHLQLTKSKEGAPAAA
jgi:hypothetical protein